VPLLKEPAHPWDHPELTTHGQGNHALRNESWHYIRFADDSEELYDHTTDSNAWTNLAGRPELADVRSDLAKSLPTKDASEPTQLAARDGKRLTFESKAYGLSRV